MEDNYGDEGGVSVAARESSGGNARYPASEVTPTPLSSASFREGRSSSRRRAPVRPPSLDADDFMSLMHGSDPVKVELNRLENEVRGQEFVVDLFVYVNCCLNFGLI